MVGRKRSPTGRIAAGGVDVLVQPSNAIRISQQTRHILLVFNSVHKINQEEYRFPPFYYENSALGTRDPFIVEFLFSTGNHEAIFNAMAVVLEDDNGSKHHPVSVYALVPTPVHPRMSFYDRAISGRSSFLCGIPEPDADLAFHQGRPTVLKKYEHKPADPVPLGKGGLYCFAVKFGIPPLDPRSTFTITINGLSVDGQKVPVPGISFVPDAYIDVTP
ncbi:hypothetical protein SCL_0743 [Sulfuricaulis limicola]|uniref:Uncharacterized protein n=1 Tax=Sulfuricaulis limicola TaxID=1620215 RepID=A0A1B4XE64_9GAMM|nr:hypothetical protein [Sulfuricaulis limicola]BAV33063.1 hypothetical protein SCL_0743 [Sulfuricaulis limicola]